MISGHLAKKPHTPSSPLLPPPHLLSLPLSSPPHDGEKSKATLLFSGFQILFVFDIPKKEWDFADERERALFALCHLTVSLCFFIFLRREVLNWCSIPPFALPPFPTSVFPPPAPARSHKGQSHRPVLSLLHTHTSTRTYLGSLAFPFPFPFCFFGYIIFTTKQIALSHNGKAKPRDPTVTT